MLAAMQVGLVGSGNMARAMARGWGDPVLCTDAGSGRAGRLAEELGGEAVASNAELAERADVLFLCHKPAQLEAVAAELAGSRTPVVSVLARVSLAELQRTYGDTPAARIQPNLAVEVRRGVTLVSDPVEPAALRAGLDELLGRLGMVVHLPDERLGAAAACSGVGPAYFALVAEAMTDAAVRHGVPAAQGAAIVAETMAGTAALLERRGHDTLAVRREVASPGGTTARGLAALEREGLRPAFMAAMDDVMGSG